MITADKLSVHVFYFIIPFMLPAFYFFLQESFVAELNQVFEDADERRKVSCMLYSMYILYIHWIKFMNVNSNLMNIISTRNRYIYIVYIHVCGRMWGKWPYYDKKVIFK